MKTSAWMEALETLIGLQKSILLTLERELERERITLTVNEPQEQEEKPVQRTL